MGISIKEVRIEEALKVHEKIPEFRICKKDFFEKRYSGKNKLVIVAYMNKKPAGYAVAYDKYKDGSLYCAMAAVVPEFRRKGIYTKMMEYRAKWARKNGYSKLSIRTRNKRREELAYLINNGFNFTSIKKGKDITESCIFLEKDI